MRPIDITGQQFGKLTAVRYVESRKVGGYMRTFWLFVCECGKERVAAKTDVVGGKIASCGCWRRENAEHTNEKRREKAVPWWQEVEDKSLGLTADQLANRAVVPASMRNLPGRLVQARHVDGHSVGVPMTGKGVSSIAMEVAA